MGIAGAMVAWCITYGVAQMCGMQFLRHSKDFVKETLNEWDEKWENQDRKRDKQIEKQQEYLRQRLNIQQKTDADVVVEDADNSGAENKLEQDNNNNTGDEDVR